MSGKTNFSVLLAMCVFLLGIGTTSFAGQIYHVDSVIGDDDNAGLTHETAFATIQKGIEQATGEFIELGQEGSTQGLQDRLGILWLLELISNN